MRAGDLHRPWQFDPVAAESCHRGLEVDGRAVVAARADARRRSSRCSSPSASSRAHHVEVVDGLVAVGRRACGSAYSRMPGLLVRARGRAACVVPAVELGQQHAQHGGLELVEARVVAHLGVGDLVRRAVEAQAPGALGDVGVVGDDRAAVAQAAEVLRGEEARTWRRGRARRSAGRRAWPRSPARRPPAPARPGPSAPSTGAGLPNRCTGRIAARVVGQRRPATVAQRDVHRRRVDVGEDRQGAGVQDRLDARVEGERRGRPPRRPAFTPSARRAIVSASVPLPTPIAWLDAQVVGELALERARPRGRGCSGRSARPPSSRSAMRSW